VLIRCQCCVRTPQDKGDDPYNQKQRPKCKRMDTIYEILLMLVGMFRARVGSRYSQLFCEFDVAAVRRTIACNCACSAVLAERPMSRDKREEQQQDCAVDDGNSALPFRAGQPMFGSRLIGERPSCTPSGSPGTGGLPRLSDLCM